MADPFAAFPDAPSDPFDQFPDAPDEQDQITFGDSIADAGDQFVRGLYRGADAMVRLPGQILGAGINAIAPGTYKGTPIIVPPSEMISGERVEPRTMAGRFAEEIGMAAGASVLPTVGIAARGARAAGQAAQTATGQIGQRMVGAYRDNPARFLRADAAATVGAGTAGQIADEADAHPLVKMGLQVAGGTAPSALAGAGRWATQGIRQQVAKQGQTGAYANIAERLPGSVEDFADDVAVGASTRIREVQRRTLDVLGEEMQRAGGDVRRAEAATVQRVSTEFGLAEDTVRTNIRNLAGVHRSSNLMLGEYPAVARADVDTRLMQNVGPEDVRGIENVRTQRSLDYLANNGNTQSGINVRNAVERRDNDLPGAIRRMLEDIGPQHQDPVTGRTRPADIEDVANLLETARREGNAAYRATYRGPINNYELLYRLPRILDATRRRAAGRAGQARQAINDAVDQFYTVGPDGQRLEMMTLQQLQDARTVVRGQMDQFRSSGRAELAGAVEPFYDMITNLMERASPQWGVANRQWADLKLMEMADELGESFATRASPKFREHLDKFNGLAEPAQNIVRIQFLQKMYDNLDNETVALFKKPHIRRMIGEMFGQDAARTFSRAMRDQEVAARTRRMMGGSPTAPRLAEREAQETEAGLVAAVEQANFGSLRSWLGQMLARAITERRNRPMADVLTTPMSDTARVAQHIYNMRQAQSRMQQLAQPRLRLPATPGQIAPASNALLEVLINRGDEGAR